MKEKNDILNLLNKIYDNPSYSQRNLANKLGFSIGKINYCLQALKSKGWIKIKNFKNNKNWGYEILTKKPLTASKNEVLENNRARSAKLRVGRFIN